MKSAELPKLLFKPGSESQVEKINNRCMLATLNILKKKIINEYNKVLEDPVFGPIMAMHQQNLGYSARLIHNFMCRQLITDKKHELWFVFARRPLRFSLQEFHTVTRLNYKHGKKCNFTTWKSDGGFWSNLLRENTGITMQKLLLQDLNSVNEWSREDRLRLVYLFVIAGVVMAQDKTVNIPREYIVIVMDVEKLWMYLWGRHAFDMLVEDVIKTREKLAHPKGYALRGFSLALQVWTLEAIPDFGLLLGPTKEDDEITSFARRCSKWKGTARISYEEFIQFESTFHKEHVVHPYISSTGNFDVIDSTDFVRGDEMADGRVDCMKTMIMDGNDWSEFIWGFEEPSYTYFVDDDANSKKLEAHIEFMDGESEVGTPSGVDRSTFGSNRGQKRVADPGFQARKQKLLCQRSGGKQSVPNEDMKSFIQRIIDVSLSTFEKNIVCNCLL